MMGGSGGGMGGGAGGWMMLLQGLGDVGEAFQTGKFSKEQAARARMFIKNMYKHRYQWQMEDMEKAGLNPILSAFTGAPTPSGAPVAETPNIRGATSRAIDRLVTAAQVANIAKDTQLKEGMTQEAYLRGEASATQAALNQQQYRESQAREAQLWGQMPHVEDKIKAEIAERGAQATLNSARAATERAGLPAVRAGSSLGGWGGRLYDTLTRLIPDARDILQTRKPVNSGRSLRRP